MAYAAIGTDTGCSVRQPAQCCGIVGLKPSFGLVGKSGVMPLVHSMDHVGPLTRSVADAALVLHAMVGVDLKDPDSVDVALPALAKPLGASIAGKVIGVPRGFFYAGGDREVIDVVAAALPVFERLGAALVEVEIEGIAAAYQAADVTFAEIAEAYGAAMAEQPAAFSDEFTRRFANLARSSAHEYAEAQTFREHFKARVATLMQRCDFLAVPTSTVAAAPIAAQPPAHAIERRKNACIFNFTGQPAISVPCGFTSQELPVGLMLAGRLFEDTEVLQAAHAFERATPWHLRHPPIA
jgi:aspartyl-tRNA(Asn)/glutamyl-tRNA(Gln) amidotransferase subunit A